MLHKLFESWNLPVSTSHRFEGDTEYFDLVCWPRVQKFLSENCDLADGAQLLPLMELVPPKSQVPHAVARCSDPSRLSKSKKDKIEAAIARAKSEFEDAIQRIQSGIVVLNGLQLQCCQIFWDGDREGRFILIKTRDKADFDIANELIHEEWSSLTIRNSSGTYGFSQIVGTIYSWENKFIRVNLSDMEHAMFDPYREVIVRAFAGLQLYGSCSEAELLLPAFEL